MTTLDLARDYVSRGFSIIPVRFRDKRPAIESWKKFQERIATEDEVLQWFGNGLPKNIGIVTGKISGIAVIDYDSPEAVQFAKDHDFPVTPTVRTGRGFHAYFQYREGTRNFQKRDDLPGIDLRGDGGYVVAPPSVHESGHTYSWVPGQTLSDIVLALLPEVVLTGRSGDKTPLRCVYGGVEQGSRNNTLARLCGSWVRDGLTIDECMEQSAIWNQRNNPPLGDHEIKQTVKSIFGKHHRKNDQENEVLFEVRSNLTDLGNARRLVAAHGRDLRYCYSWGKWLTWNGTRWKIDDSGEVERRAKDTIRLIYQQVAESSEEGRRKDLAKHALKSEGESRIKAMIELAKSEQGVPIQPEEMDKDPWALNVANGTINLKTGDLRPHTREDKITKIAPVEYRPDVPCTFWFEHLARVFEGNDGMISFLQLAFGYSLTAFTDERVIFFSHGLGANGKTTTHELIAEILGDYAVRTPTESILVKREGAIPNDLARLRGARFVFCSEVEEGKRLAESLIKDLTGGDTLSARFMRGEWFEFEPTFKIWLATNHKPVIRGTDNAIWDRIRLIPFVVSIPPEERIPRSRMMEKLIPELPGVLAWLVQGAQDWARFGLGTPPEIREATQQYRADMDAIGAFLTECCLLSPQACAAAKSLYEAYCTWCEGSGEHALSQKAFGTRLSERGFQRQRSTSTGRYSWLGIGLMRDLPE